MSKNNTVKLIGNFVKEARNIENNGNSFAAFSLATTDSYKDDKGEWQNKETIFHNNILAFNQMAKGVALSLKAGTRAEIVGYLTYRRKELAGKGGKKIITYDASIIAESVKPAPLWKKSKPANKSEPDKQLSIEVAEISKP